MNHGFLKDSSSPETRRKEKVQAWEQGPSATWRLEVPMQTEAGWVIACVASLLTLKSHWTSRLLGYGQEDPQAT